MKLTVKKALKSAKDKRGTRCQWCSLRAASGVDENSMRICNPCKDRFSKNEMF
jgi:hypothetical protein